MKMKNNKEWKRWSYIEEIEDKVTVGFYDVTIFHFFKSLLNLLQYSSCCLYPILGACEACGILTAPPALEGRVLTTGPLRKFQDITIFQSCPDTLAILI